MSPKYGKLIGIAVLVIILALVSIVLSITNTAFEPIRATLITFWVSFCVGMAGAGVYLSLLLMTEKNVAILKNELIPDLSLMTFLFLLSGGFVAAVIQTSTGILTSSGIQAVFMLGFGWQGAISGIAGTGTRVKLTEENVDLRIDANRAQEKGEVITEMLEKKTEELRKKLIELRKKGGEG